MILKIDNQTIQYFNRFVLDLKYNSVASAFSFDGYFDHNDPVHKALFKPGAYKKCTVEHNDELLITGTLLSTSLHSSPVKELTGMGGYSLPGVLEDCEIPTSLYPLQSDGLSLREIAQKLIRPFGLKMEIDSSVSSKMDGVFKTSTANEKQSIKSYLTELATQKNINITHNSKGALLFTKAKTKQEPIINLDFTNTIPGTSMALTFNGQQMHSSITVQKQASSDGGNAGESSINNPYAAGVYRPKVKIQTSGDDISTGEAARNALSEELKGIVLTITTDRVDINKKLVRPNSIISIVNPQLHIYKKAFFFIESVHYEEDETKKISTWTCVLPEVYNESTPVNIFL